MADFKGLTITQAITEFGEGVPTTRVTEGNYLFELDSLVGSMTNDGEPFISYRARIAEGPIGMEPQGAGLPIWTMCSFAEKREWATGQMLAAVGIPVAGLVGQKYPEGPAGFEAFKRVCAALTAQVKGRKFGGVVADYTGGKVPVSQILKPIPETEYQAQKAAASARPPAQPPTNGTASEPTSNEEIASQLGSLLASPAAV